MNAIKDISLQFQCNESWEAMTPCNGGRHCQVCSKTVVDFTQKSKEEFDLAVIEHQGQLCGRFLKSQTVYQQSPPRSFFSKWMAAIVLFFGFSSCDQYDEQIQSDASSDSIDEVNTIHTLGAPMKASTPDKDTTKTNISKKKTGKVTDDDTASFPNSIKEITDTDDEFVFGMFSEPMPEYLHGGEEGMMRFISENLHVKDSVGGRVMVSFTVDTTGHVINTKVVKGLSINVDSAVVNVINQLEFEKPKRPFYYHLPIIIETVE